LRVRLQSRDEHSRDKSSVVTRPHVPAMSSHPTAAVPDLTSSQLLTPLLWLTAISLTVNVIGGLGWLLEALRDCRNRRQKPGQSAEMEADSGRMYRVVDLVLSQSLALYALATLLWLPLLQEVFLPPSEQALQYLMPAVCVAVGRHVFFSCRGWRAERGLVASLTHAVSAVCLLLFLHTGTTLLLAALMMMTELGSLYTQLAGLLGERRAARCPSWVPGLGLVLAVVFSGLVYLLVLALALGRRSPMDMEPLAVSVFFFYVTYSFIMNTYAIYLVAAAFLGSLLAARMEEARAAAAAGPRANPQALDNLRVALEAARAGQDSAAAADQVKCSDKAVLLNNLV